MSRTIAVLILLSAAAAWTVPVAAADRSFNPEKDLISLHYDHAPDKDDGHSAAADRSLLETMFGAEWLPRHVVPVSGAYGLNKNTFNPKSDAVMKAVWDERGGWVAAHGNWDKAVEAVAARWTAALDAGGDVWVKEGGQSDITADAVRLIQKNRPAIDTRKRIHVVQHSNWNENKTTKAALEFTKNQTDYIRIKDANRYLCRRGDGTKFAAAARSHRVFGKAWAAAFDYYDPKKIVDFSDTGELMRIVGLGELGIDEFQKRFLGMKRDY